jgi:hypothetical protein
MNGAVHTARTERTDQMGGVAHGKYTAVPQSIEQALMETVIT